MVGRVQPQDEECRRSGAGTPARREEGRRGQAAAGGGGGGRGGGGPVTVCVPGGVGRQACCPRFPAPPLTPPDSPPSCSAKVMPLHFYPRLYLIRNLDQPNKL